MSDLITVLIVDDKKENIFSLEALLGHKPVKLISTTSPTEALKICWNTPIDIALVDVQMPEMDGFELVELLKKNPRTRDIMVVFVTAISKGTEFTVKGLSAGAIDYLYKPLDPYITSAKVDSFIRMIKAQKEVKRKNAELENYHKELIAARDAAERSKKVKETFLANMSHEIRTPINGILGLVHLLKETKLDKEQENLIDLLQVSGESLLGVVNDILDISKIEAGKFKIVRAETNIRKVVNAAVELLRFKAKEKNVTLELNIDSLIPDTIVADSLRLNQILLNLLSNAIKFTERGQVTLSLTMKELSSDFVKVQFAVKDTGIGIPADKIEKIFDSYEQAEDDTSQRFGGTGLGLSIVKRLAELKGGTLDVQSIAGGGSTFAFTNTYSYITGNVNNVDNSKQEELEKLNISVLLAEDNMINQYMIKKILANWEVKVDAVDDGEKVLQKLQEQHYDLILMDTHMPVMNGYEAIRLIRTTFAGSKQTIPIISLSANVLEEEINAALEAGADDALSKPFDISVLHAKMAKLISVNI